jgi:hypothetical protein
MPFLLPFMRWMGVCPEVVSCFEFINTRSYLTFWREGWGDLNIPTRLIQSLAFGRFIPHSFTFIFIEINSFAVCNHRHFFRAETSF